MDKKNYFINPAAAQHRHYEALRTIHVEDVPLEQAARQFNLSPAYLKKINGQFHRMFVKGEDLFFPPPPKGRKKGRATAQTLVEHIVALRKNNHSVPDIRAILAAEENDISLATIDNILKQEGFAPLPKRTRQERAAAALPKSIQAPESAPIQWANETFTTEHAGGPLVFLPLLEQLGLVPALKRAGFPKTAVLSDTASLLSFLALKLVRNERLSHDAPYNMDRAMGLFAGLNVLPKSGTLSSYSYRCTREQNRALLLEMSRIFKDADAEQGEFNLDFKAIPHWGDQSVLENNWAGMRGKGIKSLLALLVEDPATGFLSYADAGIRHRNESDAVLEFVDFWKQGRGVAPNLLVFDSRFTTYENLSKLNRDGIAFLTLRRRGKNIVTTAEALPPDRWQTVTFEMDGRKRRTVRVCDSLVSLRHYEGKVRQIVLTGHGHKHPAFLISNDTQAPVEVLLKKYARRWLVEQEIAEQVSFFHLNSPSSSIVVKVDFDLTLSLLAHNLFRVLTAKLPGFERCTVDTIARDVLQNAATVSIENRNITVRLKKKTHLPTVFELPWMKERTVLSWMEASIAYETATSS
jgi:hypothetical protein